MNKTPVRLVFTESEAEALFDLIQWTRDHDYFPLVAKASTFTTAPCRLAAAKVAVAIGREYKVKP